MPRFIEGQDRRQVTLLPESLDDFIADDNAVRVVDAFVEELNLQALGFEGTQPAETGRPSYHPAVLLKIYIYGYLNRVQSTRRLERECQRNLELMWLSNGASLMAALFQRRVDMPNNQVFPLSRIRELHLMGLIARRGYGPTAAKWRERVEALYAAIEREGELERAHPVSQGGGSGINEPTH